MRKAGPQRRRSPENERGGEWVYGFGKRRDTFLFVLRNFVALNPRKLFKEKAFNDSDIILTIKSPIHSHNQL